MSAISHKDARTLQALHQQMPSQITIPANPSVVGREECQNHPFVSVVVCTLGSRGKSIACLDSLLTQACARCEIFVVLNGPYDDEFRQEIAKHPVQFLHEARRGVCVARNHAIPYTRGELVAFVDDDVVIHTGWLHEVIRGFEDPSVGCVTGRVVPSGPAIYGLDRFDRYYASDRALSTWTLSVNEPNSYIRALADPTGFGCNMAFRRRFFEMCCTFPEDLGAGSFVGAGDEFYMFVQVLKHGFRIHHTPHAIVTHFFEAGNQDQGPRANQIYSAGVALATKLFLEEPKLRTEALRWVFSGLKRRVMRVLFRRTIASEPQELLSPTEKIRAYLRGPYVYWKSRRLRKSTGKSIPAS